MKNIKPAIAMTATAAMTPIAALTPVLSPVDDVTFMSPDLFFPVSSTAPRVVGVEIWLMVVGSPVPVAEVTEEDDVDDVDEDDDVDVDVVEEEVDEIFTPCASIVESETLNHELLATTEVAPCLKSRKLNWLLNVKSNLAPPSVPSILIFHLYVFALMFSELGVRSIWVEGEFL